MNKGLSFLALGILILLVGCADRSEPEVYTVEKEETPEPPPSAPEAPFAGGMDSMATDSMPNSGGMAAPGDNMRNRSLPDSAVNQSTDNPDWQVPATWQRAGGSAMRRASFQGTGSGGTVDIAVTSFPGDVGGLTANVNRWRRQIGLAAQSPAEVEAAVQRRKVGPHEATLCEMASAGQATLAAIFSHEGNSWFFKMTGPRASVS